MVEYKTQHVCIFICTDTNILWNITIKGHFINYCICGILTYLQRLRLAVSCWLLKFIVHCIKFWK